MTASWGIAQKTASEKIGGKCFLSSHFAHIFSLAVFRAAPQLSNFLPEKILRWPNTVFARAFADAIQHVHKDFKKQTCRQ